MGENGAEEKEDGGASLTKKVPSSATASAFFVAVSAIEPPRGRLHHGENGLRRRSVARQPLTADAGSTLEDVLPPLENRDPGDETAEDES